MLIYERTLNKYLWKDTFRCVVQLSSVDSISILVHPNDLNFVIPVVLGISNDINNVDYFKHYSLKTNIP